MTLQIAMLGERKNTKIIALLEEQGRDNPLLESRVDREADEMGQISDSFQNLVKIEGAKLPKGTS
nr:hypothetical protein [Sphingomonas sp. PAMC 26617]